MDYRRMPIEIESPEQAGYSTIDCNLAESSVNDLPLGKIAMPDPALLLSYGDHLGKPALRKLIADEHKLPADSVLVTAGAAAALFIVNTSLLNKGDHALILKPNYSTNMETPRMLGCTIDFLELAVEEDFELNLERLKKMLKPSTKLISITTPHNPTGTIISTNTIKEIISLAEKTGTYILVDETYRELRFTPPEPLAACLHPRVISVCSLSKAYGLPGLRIGWIVSQDKQVMEKFLAAKEQIFICNSLLDEEMAFAFLSEKDKFIKTIHDRVSENFSVLKDWMKSEKNMDWVEPKGGVIAFPWIKGRVDIDKFYHVLNTRHKTFTGPGHWFEMDKRFMRIGYAWPDKEQLIRGLQNIRMSLQETVGAL